MTSSIIWRALTKSLVHSEHNPMLPPSTPTPSKPKPSLPHCLLVHQLTHCLHDPTASLASYLWRKSCAYMRPWPPAGPLRDHVTCHSWHPKEWLKGVVATTWSGYCPLHLFRFPLFHDHILWPVYCPFHFVLLLQACAHALTFPICLSVLYSLFPKCACQSCINIGPCPFVCSPVSLS